MSGSPAQLLQNGTGDLGVIENALEDAGLNAAQAGMAEERSDSSSRSRRSG